MSETLIFCLFSAATSISDEVSKHDSLSLASLRVYLYVNCIWFLLMHPVRATVPLPSWTNEYSELFSVLTQVSCPVHGTKRAVEDAVAVSGSIVAPNYELVLLWTIYFFSILSTLFLFYLKRHNIFQPIFLPNCFDTIHCPLIRRWLVNRGVRFPRSSWTHQPSSALCRWKWSWLCLTLGGSWLEFAGVPVFSWNSC